MTEKLPYWKRRLELKHRSKKIKRHMRRAEGATVRHARRFIINRWDKIREIRFHVIGWLAGVGALIGIVGLQMVWFQQSYVTTAPIEGGTYAEAVRGPIETLNPLYATTPAELSAVKLVFSSLYKYDTTGNLKGDLATSITSKDDEEFTVTLRRDAKWHDGEPLTAKDVVFTVNTMRDPAARSVLAPSWQGIAAEYIDDQTVRFLLPAAYAAFPQALTFAILPQHLLESVEPSTLRENTYSTNPVGSGPFAFQLLQTVSSQIDRKIVYLNADNSYYKGRPHLDRFQLHTYKDNDAIKQALRTGEVTGASDISGELARAIDSKRYDLVVRPVNSGVYTIFNLSNPILKDKKIRTALRYATDTEAIREQMFSEPQVLDLPFIPEQVAGSEKITAPKVNVAQAAKILNKEGWKLKDGIRTKKGKELRFRVVTRQNTEYESALKLLIKQWSAVGVQLDAEIYDTNDTTKSFASDILQPRNYDILVDELVIGADPDVFAFWHSGGLLNFSEYGNDISDDALASARSTSDPALRVPKYMTFARQWLADVPAIGLYRSNFIYAHTKATNVIGKDETIVSPSDHYAGVQYWTAERGRVYKTP
tara:strand:- start:7918 stop:9699 length:1782 start_codon:yes stop_codon:yes gene_type:complete